MVKIELLNLAIITAVTMLRVNEVIEPQSFVFMLTLRLPYSSYWLGSTKDNETYTFHLCSLMSRSYSYPISYNGDRV